MKAKIQRAGLSNSEVGRRAGVARETVQRWFNDPQVRISARNMWLILDMIGLSPIAEALGHNTAFEPADGIISLIYPSNVVGDLMRLERTDSLSVAAAMKSRERLSDAVLGRVEDESGIEAGSETPVPNIPTFKISVAAGPWQDVSEIAEVRDPAQIDHGLFRIYISGDSMMPKYKPREIIEFLCLRDGRHQLEVGNEYYVQKGDLATFKRLAKIEDDRLTFKAINSKKYPKPMVVEKREIVRMALAVGRHQPL